MIRRFCRCKKCGKKIYNLEILNIDVEYPKYNVLYYCELCNYTGRLNINETYIEDTDDGWTSDFLLDEK